MCIVRMERKSEKSAIGMLAPAKLENPMNQMICGSIGRRASRQSGNESAVSQGENKEDVSSAYLTNNQ